MSDEVEQLKAALGAALSERDAARRKWCIVMASGDLNARSSDNCLWEASRIAHTNGWDCFKDEIAKRPDPWLYDHRTFDPSQA